MCGRGCKNIWWTENSLKILLELQLRDMNKFWMSVSRRYG